MVCDVTDCVRIALLLELATTVTTAVYCPGANVFGLMVNRAPLEKNAPVVSMPRLSKTVHVIKTGEDKTKQGANVTAALKTIGEDVAVVCNGTNGSVTAMASEQFGRAVGGGTGCKH
jgi:hypothetical protein